MTTRRRYLPVWTVVSPHNNLWPPGEICITNIAVTAYNCMIRKEQYSLEQVDQSHNYKDLKHNHKGDKNLTFTYLVCSS